MAMDLKSIANRLTGKRTSAADALLLAPQFPQHDIGRGSYGRIEVIDFADGTQLSIGNYCSFADGVKILLGGEHRSEWVTTYPFNAMKPEFRHIPGHPKSKGDIRIGNDVWVASEAMILSGVTIGDGAIIGARALVTRDVEPYSIVAGNPARHVRYRFSKDVVDRLRKLAWWDWPEARLMNAVPLLLSADIEHFLSAAEKGDI